METETLALAQEIDFSILALFCARHAHREAGDDPADRWPRSGRGRSSSRRSSSIAARAPRRRMFDRGVLVGRAAGRAFRQDRPGPERLVRRRSSRPGCWNGGAVHRDDGGLIAGAQARIDRSMDVAIDKEAEALNRGLPFLATVGSTAPVHRAVRHRLGHHERLHRDRAAAEHQPGRRGAGHRRGAAGHRPGPAGGDPGGDLLQQAERGQRPVSSAATRPSPTSSATILSRQLDS